MTSLGLSPRVRALLPHGAPAADLSSLRTFVTTGEPWNPEPYRWLAETVGGSRVPVINCSGGTEVGACSLSPTPVGPIKACSLGGPALGMAMDVVDDQGGSLLGTGEVGELVCRKPFPGMTRGFWRNPDKYLETYWARIPGVWVHGDWAFVERRGVWYVPAARTSRTEHHRRASASAPASSSPPPSGIRPCGRRPRSASRTR